MIEYVFTFPTLLPSSGVFSGVSPKIHSLPGAFSTTKVIKINPEVMPVVVFPFTLMCWIMDVYMTYLWIEFWNFSIAP